MCALHMQSPFEAECLPTCRRDTCIPAHMWQVTNATDPACKSHSSCNMSVWILMSQILMWSGQLKQNSSCLPTCLMEQQYHLWLRPCRCAAASPSINYNTKQHATEYCPRRTDHLVACYKTLIICTPRCLHASQRSCALYVFSAPFFGGVAGWPLCKPGILVKLLPTYCCNEGSKRVCMQCRREATHVD
jgi:hypothetical protein